MGDMNRSREVFEEGGWRARGELEWGCDSEDVTQIEFKQRANQSRQRGQKIFLWASVADFCEAKLEERRGGVGRTVVVERREVSVEGFKARET